MQTLPVYWDLVEEWEGSFVFENTDQSFQVHIDFNPKLKIPYLIGYEQLTGDYELIDFEDSVFTTTAANLPEAMEKAVLLMQVINLKMNGTDE